MGKVPHTLPADWCGEDDNCLAAMARCRSTVYAPDAILEGMVN